MDAVETVRARYRPERITTLFVGESAPSGGDFFYNGNNNLLLYMQRATEAVLGGNGDFLERFKAYGWYLDDLVLTPVDNMKKPERMAKCLAAQNCLRNRIANYRPLAIVSLLLGIKKIVYDAASAADSNARLFAVPFAGMGHQSRFHKKMVEIIPQLPRLPYSK